LILIYNYASACPPLSSCHRVARAPILERGGTPVRTSAFAVIFGQGIRRNIGSLLISCPNYGHPSFYEPQYHPVEPWHLPMEFWHHALGLKPVDTRRQVAGLVVSGL
jgi:hypothetical protein